MGRSKKGRVRLGASLERYKTIGLFLLLTFLSVGCKRVDSPQVTMTLPAPTETYSPTLTQQASPTVEPSNTVAPEQTPTPHLPLNLSHPHPEVTYIIPITVQHKTPFSIHCYFELNEEGEGYLFYWPSKANIEAGSRVPFAENKTRHLIEITDLIPGEMYHLAVGIDDGTGSYYPPQFLDGMWDPIQVETLAEDVWPIRIAVFGDSGFGQEITYQLAEQMASHDLDFILHTGDVVYHVFEQANVQEAFAIKYFQTLSPILKRFPLYPVPGNHEYETVTMVEDQPYYFRVFPLVSGSPSFVAADAELRRWYAVELEPLQFLMLDTQLFWRGTGSAEQTAWLAERLSNDRFKVSIPVFHVPPFTSGKHGSDGVFVQRDWLPLFEQASVPIAFSGHDHNYERLSFNGITYIVSGGGSSVLYPANNTLPNSQYFARRTHFILLEIYPEYLEISAITPDGEILDWHKVDFPAW